MEMWGPWDPERFFKNNIGVQTWMLLGNMGPGTPADFLRLMPGSGLGYFCGNMGPWDPERFLKNNLGVEAWMLLGNMGPGTLADFF